VAVTKKTQERPFEKGYEKKKKKKKNNAVSIETCSKYLTNAAKAKGKTEASKRMEKKIGELGRHHWQKIRKGLIRETLISLVTVKF